MATRTFRGTTNSNWGTATNWLEGAVPLSTDDVVFDATSPNCSINVNSVCKTLTTTLYTNTITINGFYISVAGDITLSATTTIVRLDVESSEYGYIYQSVTANITCNGCVIPYIILGAGTHTLVDNLMCTRLGLYGVGTFAGAGLLNGAGTVNTFSTYNFGSTWTLTFNIQCVNAIFSLGNTSFVLNGAKTIYISGNITTPITNSAQFYLSGTCTIVYNGTGTWTGLSTIAIGFNINTVGTLTLNGMCSVATNVTHTAGTIDSTTYPNSGFSVYAILATTPTTFALGGLTIENISVSAIYGSTHNITLSQTLSCNNLRIPTWLVNFLGTAGWICNNLIITGNSHNQYGLPVYTNRYLQLLTGEEYVVNNSLLIATDNLMPFNIKSSTATPALLTFNGTKQQVLNCNVQNIDSSNGKTIWYDNDAGTGTKTNAINWSPLQNSSMVPITISSVF